MGNNIIQLKQINREEIEYLIRNLEGFEKSKALKQGLRDAGKVFQAGGRSRLKGRLKTDTGNLVKSFNTRVKRRKPGVLVGFTKKGAHAHLVDRGTDKRYWKTKTQKYVGKAKANYFWTETEQSDYPKAIDKLYVGIEKAVERINSRR